MGGTGGYLLIECGDIVAMQMRSIQLVLSDLDVASRDWLGGCLTSAQVRGQASRQ